MGHKTEERFAVFRMFGAIVLASSVFIPGASFASTSLAIQESKPSRAAPASVFEPFDFYQEGGELRLVDTRLRQHSNAFTMDRARYKARMTSYLGAGAAIHYQYKNHSLAFTPRGLSWSGNGETALGIRRLPNQVPARLVVTGDELEGAGGSRLAGRGVIYENAYGEGLHLGALAKKTVLRKLVRFDSLEALGQIPDQAAFLQLAFELRTEGGTYFKAGFDDEHPYRWDERDPLVADGIPVEFGRGSERSFMLPAHAWDSIGRKIAIRLELRREAKGLLLVKMIPVDWLSRADFPVYADVDLTFGAEFIFESNNTEWVSMASIDANHVVIAYQDVVSSGAGTAVVGTITGETIAFGTPVPFLLTEARNIFATALDSTHVLIAYQDVANSNFGTAIVGTVSGDVIAFNGSAEVFEFSNTVLIQATALDAGHVVIAYRAGTGWGTAVVGEITPPDTISFGTTVVFNADTTYSITASALDATHVLVTYSFGGEGIAVVGTITLPTTISFGASAVFDPGGSNQNATATLDSTRALIAYHTGGGGVYRGVVATITPPDILSFGPLVDFDDVGFGAVSTMISADALDSDHVAVAYRNNRRGRRGSAIVATITGGTNLSFGTPSTFDDTEVNYPALAALDSARVVVAYKDVFNLNRGTAVVGWSLGTVRKLIGFETGDELEMAVKSAGALILPGTARLGSGDYALNEPATSTLVQAMSPMMDTIGIRFSFKKGAPAGIQTLIQLKNGLTDLWHLQLTGAGLLQVVADESLSLTGTTLGSTPLADDTWYTVRLVYDAAVGGALKVWLDSELQVDAGHDLQGTAIDEITVSGPASATYFYDDFYISDTIKLPPPGQIVRRGPMLGGSATGFSLEEPPLSPHFQNVDELSHNDDTDYNHHDSTVATDLYAIEDSPVGAINAVKAMWRMKHGTGGAMANVHHYAWLEDTLPWSENLASLSQTWETKETIWREPPNSGRSWTNAKFDDMELGAKHNDTGARDTFLSWTVAMLDYDDGTITAVKLTSFTATAGDSEVLLEWETGSEMNNLGFHLYRSTGEGGPYTPITARPIPGLGSSPEGAKYRYRDQGLTNGVTYYYKLEDIETTGKTEMHGPVSATPQAGAGFCCNDESGEDDPKDSGDDPDDSRITVGAPELNRLRIVEAGGDEVVLELETGGFYAEPQEDGTVRIWVPGYTLTQDAGYPSLPVRRAWVEALAGRKVSLVSVESLEAEWYENLKPWYVGEPVVEVTRRGTVRAVRKTSRRRETRQSSPYPQEGARILSVGYQGDVKKALVELAPIRWDPTMGSIVLAHRLVVRLSFRGRDLSERTLSRRRGRSYRRSASHENRSVVARFVTKERGLYVVSYDDVLGGDRRQTVVARSLRLSRHGEAVAYHLEPNRGGFGPGTNLYFLSEGAEANPYGTEAVYELEVGVSGEVMPVRAASPGGETTEYYWELVEKEIERIYQSTLVNAPDRWLWSMLFAPATKVFPFEVDALAATTSESSRLTVWLQGGSDFDAEPDHHVRLYVNGNLVGETSWDGKTPQRLDADLLPGVVVEGENRLEIENVGDTPAQYSTVMLDRFRVEYPRLPQASEGHLEGNWSASGTAEIEGLSLQAAVIELGESGPVWLEGVESTETGVRFGVEEGRGYLAVSPEAVRIAEVRRPLRSRWKVSGHSVDYVVIGPQEFIEVTGALLELRRSQGLVAEAVSLEEVYSEFGFGEERPEAIRDFLSYAYHNWKVAPRYVVLLGDATFDFKNYLGAGVVNHMPPMMVMTTYLETASDPSYAAVNGEDLLPDLAIGRLPAATVEELEQMVSKIVSWESSGKSLEGRVVLVADNPDKAGNFDADAEELSTTFVNTQELAKIYLSKLGSATTRSEILRAFDEGSSLMSYIGHGGIHLWADENIWNIYDVPSLSPQSEQPILLTMNCLNGYFTFPFFNSLAEELIKAEDKGVIAAFSPSGLSLNDAAHVFHKALLEELVYGSHVRLGDAVLGAQGKYAESGAFPEMLAIYHLFGDPAMKIQ